MPWHVSQAYKIESHEHSVFFGSVPSVGPICWGFRKYGMAVEWGLGYRNLPALVAAALILTWVTFRRMRSSYAGCKRAGIEARGVVRTFEVFSVGDLPLGKDKHVVFTIISLTDTPVLLVWVSRTPLGPQWLCLETRFSRDGMVLPFLEPQRSGEDPQLYPKRLPLKNPETRGRSVYRCEPMSEPFCQREQWTRIASGQVDPRNKSVPEVNFWNHELRFRR